MSLQLHTDSYSESGIDPDNYEEFFAFRKVIPDANEEYEFYVLYPKRISIKLEQTITTFVIPEGGFKAAHLFKVDGNIRSFEFVFEVHNLDSIHSYVGRDGLEGATKLVHRPQQFRDWYFDYFESKSVDEHFYIDIYDYVAANNRYERKHVIQCLPETPTFDMDVESGPFYTVIMPFKQGGQFSEFNTFEENPGAPNPPLQFSATSGASGMATLQWSTPRDGGSPITAYNYRYKQISEGSWSDIINAPSSPYTVQNLTSGVSYDFQMQAVNANGSSLWTGTVSVLIQ